MSKREKKIIRITRSPLNPQRWCADLECGHEEWLTAKKKPTRQTIRCSRCNVTQQTTNKGRNDK